MNETKPRRRSESFNIKKRWEKRKTDTREEEEKNEERRTPPFVLVLQLFVLVSTCKQKKIIVNFLFHF